MKHIVLWLFLICIGTPAWSAPEDELMRSAGNIHRFTDVFPQEKVYLQFDNTAYFQGETIWFKAFVVNSVNLQRAPSKILYVDLLSPNGVILQQLKLKIVGGQADGAFPLMDSSTEQARKLRGILDYPSGYYEVRAYTQYMLNFNDENIFSRVLPIYSHPSEDEFFFPSEIEKTNHSREQIRPVFEQPETDVSLQFFPEGGSMVNGLPGRVAFKASDSDGLPVDGLLLIDGAGVKAATLHEGMGSFFLTPSGRKTSGVFVSTNGKTTPFELERPVQNGFNITIKQDIENRNISFTARHNLINQPDSVGISVTCRGDLIYFGKLKFDTDSVSASIATGTWPLGVCTMTLFSRKGEVLCSRSFYNNNTGYIQPRLTFRADKESYEPYDKIKLSLHLEDRRGNPFRDRFCISVRDAHEYGSLYRNNLKADMLLCSDLKGLIKDPDFYFESADSFHIAALDLLTLVQGWERYDWSMMSRNSYFRERRRMEDSLSLNGWILRNDFQKYRKVNVYATIAPMNQQLIQFGEYETDTSGYFGFNLTDYTGNASLLMALASKNRKARKARIRLERALTPSVRKYRPEDLAFPTIEKLQEEIDDIVRQRSLDEIQVLPEVRIEEKRKYVDYDTFTAFDVEKDVEKELDMGEYPSDILGYLTKKGYTVWFTGRSADDGTGVPGDAIDILNVPEECRTDADVALWMSDISRIDNYHAFWYVHDTKRSLYQGRYAPVWSLDIRNVKSLIVHDEAASIYSFLPDLALFQMPAQQKVQSYDGKRYMLVDILIKDEHELPTRNELMNLSQRITTLTGLSRERQFYSPQYPDGPIEGQPKDYRRTLYWNPNVITDSLGYAEVEFYNNSYSTHFNVSGAGITASGTPYVLDQDF